VVTKRAEKAKTSHQGGMPTPVLEILRFCIVVFFSGLGYQLSSSLPGSLEVEIGTFHGAGLGILVGAGVGYVIGGLIARLTGRTLVEAERALVRRSPEQVLAGLVGATVGVAVGAGLAWPALLLGRESITMPIFVFVCVVLGLLGYRVGISRREGLLAILGQRTTLHTLAPPVASLPRLLDTSVIIDGRIIDVVRSGFLHGVLLVPGPVMAELQGLADAGDDVRRAKGRRGLEVLESLRRERAVDIEVIHDGALEIPEVDGKLVRMALDRGVALLTLDTNLARVASLAGCRVMNLHALAIALRPPVTAGDSIRVVLTRPGKETGQGVGYLDDGTMIVVERGRAHVGQEVACVVTSVLVTANGRLVFTRLDGGAPDDDQAPASSFRRARRGPVPTPPRQPRNRASDEGRITAGNETGHSR
jgi:uncharacterized protein YacL